MNKEILISDYHSSYPNNSIRIHLQGGCPWFGYLWIDDICFTIIKTKKSYSVKKTK